MTFEHGNKGRETNLSLAGDVEIRVSECNRLYLILVVRHRRRARMQIDFLEVVFICLEIAGPSMETQYVLSTYWYVIIMKKHIPQLANLI